MSGRPPSLCKTFAVEERMRVPSPAASMSMSSGADWPCEGCGVCLSMCSLVRYGNGGARASLLVAGEDDARELEGAVSHLLALVEQVGADDLGLVAELLFELVVCEPDLARALCGVALGLLR